MVVRINVLKIKLVEGVATSKWHHLWSLMHSAFAGYLDGDHLHVVLTLHTIPE